MFLSPFALLDTWAVRAQQTACDNARVAATEVARRRVERAEVDDFLAALESMKAAPQPVAARG
jgi:membrane protein involved in colicin uptake